MMKELEKRMAAADFVGKEFMAGAKTYKVAKADNFSYTDPIDGSVSQHQVESLVGFFSLFFFFFQFSERRFQFYPAFSSPSLAGSNLPTDDPFYSYIRPQT
jgi:hypothetical protein